MEKKVLIVRTDPSIDSVLHTALNHLSHSIVATIEPDRNAVDRVLSDHPDFVLLEINAKADLDIALYVNQKLSVPIVLIFNTSNLKSFLTDELNLPFGYVLTPIVPEQLAAAFEFATYANRICQEVHQTEDNLSHGIDKYKTVIDNANDAIFVIQDGEYRLFNSTFYEELGYTEEEVLAIPFAEHIHPDDKEWVVDRYLKRIIGEDIGDVNVFRVVSKNGEVRWVENKSVMIEWENQPATLNFSADITDRQIAQKELETSERRFRNVVESSPMGLFLYRLDPGNRLIFSGYNPAANEILGVDCSQFMGKTIEEAFPPLADTEVPDRYRKAAAQGIQWWSEQIDYEYEAIKGAFEIQAFQTSPGNMAVYFFDITERKQADIALKASERRFRQLAENIREIFWIMSPESGQLLYISPMFEEIFQIKVKDLYPNPYLWLERVVPGDRDKLVTALQRNKEIGFKEIDLPEITIQRPDGSERLILARAFPVRDEKGEIYRVVGVAEDITERKKTQELMIQTEKMMSVGGMAAGMAHELNNPLGAIMQSAQNIQRRFSTDFKKNLEIARESNIDLNAVRIYMEKRNIDKFIEGIRASGERAAGIIDDMLQFSRKSESEMAPSDIHRIIEAALTLANQDFDLNKKYDFKNIEIVKNFVPDLPLIPCTETQIEQVLLNLVRNSAQSLFNKDMLETPTIEIKTILEKAFVRIEVSDNGSGIEESVKSRIFEPFFTTKGVGVGTGLGLSVSYMIITANHNGTIEVESTPSAGATFIVRLPLKRVLVGSDSN
jgi:PAS domain S-box-containing protein